MKSIFKKIIEFIINWFWVGTLEKVFRSACVTEVVWLMNWTSDKTVLSESTINAITDQVLEYMGWVTLFIVTSLIVGELMKRFIGIF